MKGMRFVFYFAVQPSDLRFYRSKSTVFAHPHGKSYDACCFDARTDFSLIQRVLISIGMATWMSISSYTANTQAVA